MSSDAPRRRATPSDDPPPLADFATLTAALRSWYRIDVAAIEEIDSGADAAARTWRCRARDGRRLFVKVRPSLRPAAIALPLALQELGLLEPVAPLRTLGGASWLDIGGRTAVVMPLIDGPTAMDAGLPLEGWRRLGAFAAAMHAATLPATVRSVLEVERFGAAAAAQARSIDRLVDRREPGDRDEDSLRVREGWRARRGRIRDLVRLSETLARRIRERDAELLRASFVPCHADLHANNVLVTPDGGIRVIDWDEALLAPRERDLMFVRGSVVAGRVADVEADAFEAGYGPYDVDRELLAHYRVDWAVQDVAGFAWEVLVGPNGDPARRRRARALFDGQFEAGDQVDAAFAIAATVGLG